MTTINRRSAGLSPDDGYDVEDRLILPAFARKILFAAKEFRKTG